MEVEFTARQVKISKVLKTDATEGVERIALVLGKITSAAFTFRAERHLQIVDLALKGRQYSIVSSGEATSQETALRNALAHAELQAQRHRAKGREQKRLPKAESANEPPLRRSKVRASAPEDTENSAASNGHKPAVARAPGKQTKAAITVHSFPGKPAVVEPHILSAAEALAIRPMTVEEAVKEAEFRDRDLLVFRNKEGDLFVLHRRRDGKMELVEIP